MANGRRGERASGRKESSLGVCRTTAKRLNIIAQGFYEAELVKAALLKSIFLEFCLVWTGISRQETYDWLFGA
jgi:hypothetical protein